MENAISNIGWTEDLQNELSAMALNGRVGSQLVSETSDLRVWQISLAKGERLPFHRHVLNYFWTVHTDGTARSHFSDGRISEMTYKQGDTKHFVFAAGECMIHDLENIGGSTLIFTTVEFKNGQNPPLPIS